MSRTSRQNTRQQGNPGEGPGRRLVIVESPTKARTIRRYLPGEYDVKASMGHVRDLPASAEDIPDRYRGEAWARLGVQVEKDFEPLYVVTKPKVIRELREAMKGAEELYIATDEDREGESIGWHLLEALKPEIPVRRMVFHEITESAIRHALEETRGIDRHLVEAQETRRLLDRLVGYTISPLLWRKIAPRLSAGRVQSVAVRLLVQREHERLRFVPAGYWDLAARLGADGRAFSADLTHVDDVRLAAGKDFDPDTGRLREGVRDGRDVVRLDEEAVRRIATAAERSPFTIDSIEERESQRHPAAPFTTSTLQQEASRKLGLAARDTMRVAQGLYENGYITYMRTDSTHLSGEAIGGSRKAIERRYGTEYLSERPRQYTRQARNAQEAHEAIRPAGSEMRTAEEHGLRAMEARLYDLIWKRTVATQMAEARLKFVTARIRAEAEGRVLSLRATGRTVLFPGFFRAYVEGSDDPEAALDDRDQPLPPLREGDALQVHALEPRGHETKPPARFTEASLVKLLEQEGIGRPSTYASIIDTIQRRGYVRKNGNQLVPTFVAFATNNLLEHQFAQLVDVEFTANMEAKLDEIAAGKVKAIPYLHDFYRGERGIESRVEAGLDAIDAKQISTIRTPRWEPYLIRVGRYGPYVEGELEGERHTTSIPEEWAPADVTREMLEERLRLEQAGDTPVGVSEDGQPMLLKNGPYGPYLQLGEDDQEGKPKRVSVPPGVEPSQVDEGLARSLLALPREIGRHPESGEPVLAGIGRYGPYVKHQRTFASLTADDDVLAVGLDRAVELLAKKRKRPGALKVLGEHPETGREVELRDGRYGPYVKHGKTNASLRKDQSVETVTLDQALELLAEREARQGRGGSKASKASKGGKGARGKSGTSSKGTRARGTGKATASKASRNGRKPGRNGKRGGKAPKATPEDLAQHLDRLDAGVREVVVRLEGMQGFEARSQAGVARELGIDPDEVAARHKRGMFKLRMAHGKARKEAGA